LKLIEKLSFREKEKERKISQRKDLLISQGGGKSPCKKKLAGSVKRQTWGQVT